MPPIQLIPPDPAHTPEGDARRGVLYPLWVLRLEIRPYPGAEPRTLYFSVDGIRGIPMPVRGFPELIEQEVPDGTRVLDAIPLEQATRNTRVAVKKGLGFLGGLVGRVQVAESRRLYKLYWILADPTAGEVLVDSRSGTRVPAGGLDGSPRKPPGHEN